MHKSFRMILLGLSALCAAWMAVAPAIAEDKAESEKYLLRYQFHPGETIRWEVEHRNKVCTTVTKITKTVETVTTSAKSWQILDVQPDGTAVFEHRVDWADMIQNMTDTAEVRYNSRTDAKPPTGFQDAAKRIGVPLSKITIDPQGTIVKREHLADANNATQNEGFITIPLPKEPVPVGYTWSYPQEIEVPLETGGMKKIKAIQMFTLEEVKTGVATIHVATEIVTPINNAAIESKLVQRESNGRVRFDIDAGRIISQRMDIDKQVVGFRGDASSIHYVDRFNEQIVAPETATAEKNSSATH